MASRSTRGSPNSLKRQNSRGAHYRDDFPDPGDLPTSRYTVARLDGTSVVVTDEPVAFTIVEPGNTILDETPRAAE